MVDNRSGRQAYGEVQPERLRQMPNETTPSFPVQGSVLILVFALSRSLPEGSYRFVPGRTRKLFSGLRISDGKLRVLHDMRSHLGFPSLKKELFAGKEGGVGNGMSATGDPVISDLQRRPCMFNTGRDIHHGPGPRDESDPHIHLRGDCLTFQVPAANTAANLRIIAGDSFVSWFILFLVLEVQRTRELAKRSMPTMEQPGIDGVPLK
jgi:hypothetical protein